MMRRLLLTIWLAGAAIARADVSPEEQAKFRALGWEKIAAAVPMRDGVRLHTEIVRPLEAPNLPILLTRTPYNCAQPYDTFAQWTTNQLKELIAEGFIFARQDVRGKFKSEGRFVMMRSDGAESRDAFDTIDWLVKNVPGNNGKVGLHGTSYLGWTTVLGTLDPHPALKAACQEASPADMWIGDDFHRNGAFRLSYGYEFAALLETAKTNVQVKFDLYDGYEWYLRFGPLANLTRHTRNALPTWNDFITHPNYDEFWQRQALAPYLTNVSVPILNVAGWYDQEDFYGPLTIYGALEKRDTNNMNFFVAGPWNHGGWNRGDARKLGAIDFAEATGPYFREEIKARWFAKHLKGQGSDFPEAITFQTGANKWEQHTEWPPRAGVARQKLYARADGKLSFKPPTDTGRKAFDEYVSDPARPVPYRTRPIEPTYGEGSRWSTWLTEDQRFVHNRPDVLTYETEILGEDVVVTGEVFATLFASTTGSDADWVIKVIDVYPQDYPVDRKMGGYQLMVASEVLRGRFRESFERPKAIEPDRVTRYAFSLRQLNHRFQKGHKIMVQIQSTWFPVIDRNPQKFVPNIFLANESDFQPATHRIHRSTAFATHLDIPLRRP